LKIADDRDLSAAPRAHRADPEDVAPPVGTPTLLRLQSLAFVAIAIGLVLFFATSDPSRGSPPALTVGACGSPPALTVGACGSPARHA
jgi:hypothetical protein